MSSPPESPLRRLTKIKRLQKERIARASPEKQKGQPPKSSAEAVATPLPVDPPSHARKKKKKKKRKKRQRQDNPPPPPLPSEPKPTKAERRAKWDTTMKGNYPQLLWDEPEKKSRAQQERIRKLALSVRQSEKNKKHKIGSNVPQRPLVLSDQQALQESLEEKRDVVEEVMEELEGQLTKLEKQHEMSEDRRKKRKDPADRDEAMRVIREIDKDQTAARKQQQLILGEISAIQHQLGVVQRDISEYEEKIARLPKGQTLSLEASADLRQKQEEFKNLQGGVKELNERLASLPLKKVPIASPEDGRKAPFEQLARRETPSVGIPAIESKRIRIRGNKKKRLSKTETPVFHSPASMELLMEPRTSPVFPSHKQNRVNGHTGYKKRRHNLQGPRKPNFSLVKLGPRMYQIRVVNINKAVVSQLRGLLEKIPGRHGVIVDGLRLPRRNVIREAVQILAKKRTVTISF